MSVLSVSAGATPAEYRNDPVTSSPRPVSAPAWVRSPKPSAASARPAAITSAGRNRRTRSGASVDPAMNPAPDGTNHKPARNGDSPSTSCRYCAMNNKVPNTTKMPSAYVASAVLKAAMRNSRRSSSGLGSRCCRRTNTTPSASPARSDSTGSQIPSPSASCLSP